MTVDGLTVAIAFYSLLAMPPRVLGGRIAKMPLGVCEAYAVDGSFIASPGHTTLGWMERPASTPVGDLNGPEWDAINFQAGTPDHKKSTTVVNPFRAHRISSQRP